MRDIGFSILLIGFAIFAWAPNTIAEDLPQLHLPEGAKARLGKGGITGNVAYSPDGTRLAVASSIGIWLYDAQMGEELDLLTGHTDWVLAWRSVPMGAPSQVRVGTTPSVCGMPRQANTSKRFKGIRIRSIAWRSGQMVAPSQVGVGTATVRLWDADTGENLKTLTGHTSLVWSVAFSPDGTTLASASRDDTIRLWDADTGEHLKTLTGHWGWVFSVVFSPDGNTLASGVDKHRPLVGCRDRRTPQNPYRALEFGLERGVQSRWGPPSQVGVRTPPSACGMPRQANTSKRFKGIRRWSLSWCSVPMVVPSQVGVGTAPSACGMSTLAHPSKRFKGIRIGSIAWCSVPMGAPSQVRVMTARCCCGTSPPQLQQRERIAADLNGDGIVNIIDLTLVASNFGKTGHNSADVNGDGVVNIIDLTLVAGAFGNTAGAPEIWRHHPEGVLTKTEVATWLRQARQINLADPAFQRGILMLEHLLTSVIPKETSLLANYPNPFNPETWIPYQLAAPADVSISIYTADGRFR